MAVSGTRVGSRISPYTLLCPPIRATLDCLFSDSFLDCLPLSRSKASKKDHKGETCRTGMGIVRASIVSARPGCTTEPALESCGKPCRARPGKRQRSRRKHERSGSKYPLCGVPRPLEWRSPVGLHVRACRQVSANGLS